MIFIYDVQLQAYLSNLYATRSAAQSREKLFHPLFLALRLRIRITLLHYCSYFLVLAVYAGVTAMYKHIIHGILTSQIMIYIVS